MYNKLSREALERLVSIAGPEDVISDREKIEDYSHDESSLPEIRRYPEVVVRPESTEEVAAVMRLAAENRIPVTPRGGATGLCGGCVPLHGGIVLALEKMNRVVEIDLDNQMAVVEAGVRLGDFSRAVEEAGLSFPPHPGDENAMIGGLIATNAGGSRAVKYGVIRNYVRGLEVVLPEGKIIRPGGKLVKSSTGYSLLHLLVGSEGTLGIITRAVIQLLPAPALSRSLVIPFEDVDGAVETVPLLLGRKIVPLAVEFIDQEVIRITEEYLNKHWPTSAGRTCLLVILDAPGEAEMDSLSQAVAEVSLEKGALDVFIADTPKKQAVVLEIRSQIYEALKPLTVELLDISVPRAEIPGHVRRIREVSLKYGIWLPTFGHAATERPYPHHEGQIREGRMVPVPRRIGGWK
jgi:glycolate oxidase